MENLVTLSAFNNKIKKLPEKFCDMTQLEVLQLQQNELVLLPETFDQLQNLKDLRLQDNPLKNPPPDVCVSGVLQPIGRFIRKALEREGKNLILIICI